MLRKVQSLFFSPSASYPCCGAQQTPGVPVDVEVRIDSMLKQLTLEEKIDLIVSFEPK